jgi:hypothetical protein
MQIYNAEPKNSVFHSLNKNCPDSIHIELKDAPRVHRDLSARDKVGKGLLCKATEGSDLRVVHLKRLGHEIEFKYFDKNGYF